MIKCYFKRRLTVLFYGLISILSLSQYAFGHSCDNYQGQVSQEKAQKICDIFKEHSLLYDIDHRSIEAHASTKEILPTGYDHLKKKIEVLIKEKKPVVIRMIGFPFKSSNHERKVIGSNPDMAEYSSFSYLNSMLKKMNEVHPVKLMIICDGCTFADVLGISDQHVENYERDLKKIASCFPYITVIGHQDLDKHCQSLMAIREKIDANDPSDLEFEKKIKVDQKLQSEFSITKKRIAKELDHKRGQKIQKERGLDEIVKKIIKRSLRFGQLVKEKYEKDDMIHASVHYQKDVSKKIGLKMSPDSFVTPWHGVLVIDQKRKARIVHKEDVDLTIYQLLTQTIQGYVCSYYGPKKKT